MSEAQAKYVTAVRDNVLDLTSPWQERIVRPEYLDGGKTRTRVDIVEHPSLVEQLGESLVPSGGVADSQAKGVFKSRPPLNMEALDSLVHLENEVDVWLRVGLKMPSRGDVADSLRLLAAECARLERVDLVELAKDTRRWLTTARTVTEWETPPWKPNVPCPLCERRSLRVRLSTQTAVCTNCREAWSPENIALLADYVRLATGGEGDLSVG